MPAKSKAQQKLFGIALAVRRGELKRDDVDDEVLNIVDSDMTDKDIEDFASTKHKGLKEYIKESILDDEEEVFNDVRIKLEIEKFIEDNYKCKRFMISNKPNKDGKFIVDGTDILVTNKNITSLTNNLFIWGKVIGNFHCSECKYLKSLEGAPKKVGGDFDCSHCKSLTSLDHLPKYIHGNLYILNIDLTQKHIESLTQVSGNIY